MFPLIVARGAIGDGPCPHGVVSVARRRPALPGRVAALAALCLLSAHPASTQPGSVPVADAELPELQERRWIHRHWTVADGLPVNVLTGVAQDGDGYLWIGTSDGLVRFDGHRFVTLRPGDEPALASPRIVDVVGDEGVVWVLTSGGLTRLLDGRLEPVSPQSVEDGEFVAVRRRAGSLWALARHALYELRPEGEARRAEEIPQDHELLDVLVDRSGRRWLLTSGGIAWSEEGRLQWQLTAAPVNGAIETDRGVVFFRQGLPPLRFSSGSWVEVPEALVPGFELSGTASVAETPWGGAYVNVGGRNLSTDGRSGELLDVPTFSFLMRPDFAAEDSRSGRWTAVGPEVRLDDEPVLRVADGSDAGALEIDQSGTVWVASSRDGLHALTPAPVTTIVPGTVPNARTVPNASNVYGVGVDRSGALWVGTHGAGAWRGTSEGWTQVPLAERQSGPVFARCFLEDSRGTLWIGLIGGVHRWGDGDSIASVDEVGAPRSRINAFVEDDLGRLWVGAADGIHRRDLTDQGPVWRRVQVDGLPLVDVRSLVWTPAGELWSAGATGLASFDGTRWERLGEAEGLPTERVRSLSLGRGDSLWVGTDDVGLLQVDLERGSGSSRITRFGTEHGLAASSVHYVIEDDAGFLWLSSNNGIFRVALSDLEEVRLGERLQLRVARFDEDDGMTSREANGGTSSAGLRTRDGRLWFATQAGVATIDPGALASTSGAGGRTVIEGLTVQAEQRPGAATMTLLPAERTFSVRYTTPAPSAARRATFRYRLVGYDDRWVEAGTRREAFFTGIPAGSYRFEVETIGVPGLLEGSRASFDLETLPRFWETSWFQVSLALLGLGLLVGLVHWRDRAQRRQRRELQRLVRERTAVIREQADRLRRLDRLKSELFTDVSHEFRTPLTLAIGPLKDLVDGVRGRLDEEARQDVSLALKNTNRLLELINQILDVARMEAGQVRLALEARPLEPFLRARVEKFAAHADRERVVLDFEALADAATETESETPRVVDPATATFDYGRLGRALDNLIMNALQWTPAGGRVVVRVRDQQLGDSVECEMEPWYEISVEDTGPGIAKRDLERIFLRFQRGETEAHGAAAEIDGADHPTEGPSSVKRRGGGTGIGLAQTREIVRLHGGRLLVESEEGRGTVFRLLLPAVPPSGVGAAQSTASAVEPGALENDLELSAEVVAATGADDRVEGEATAEDDTPLVLVVDDEPEVCDYVRRTLEPDYRVRVAADGEQALALARQEVPDAVVCDVMMPRMDGFQVVAEFHRDPELDFVPIVLLTARGADDARLEALDLGADDYLVKPFLRRELRGRIRNLLNRRRQWSEGPVPEAGAQVGEETRLHLPEIEAEPADAAFLRSVVATVEEGLGDPDLGVEELAARLNYDRTHLFRKLRDLTGETPSALLRRLRLERAERLLVARAANVSEIAYAVGFRSVSHFSRAFRGQFGTTPSAVAAGIHARPGEDPEATSRTH